jgi:hypothetical protein
VLYIAPYTVYLVFTGNIADKEIPVRRDFFRAFRVAGLTSGEF